MKLPHQLIGPFGQMLAVLILIVMSSSAFAENRRVAVTFDDLPLVSAIVENDDDAQRQATEKLLAALSECGIPVIGFVNEVRLEPDGETNEARIELLRLWLEAGHELGNHSFSHPDLHTTPLPEYQADVLKGMRVTVGLLAEQDESIRYFRHPFLHTGRDLETKRAVESFLEDRGIRVAPVTIDNSEWIYARAYDIALRDGDTETAQKVGVAYVEYMGEMFDYYEQQSIAIVGRNIDHVLLVHANRLNSDWFGELADLIASRGYEFITLDEALTDPAYESADEYVGPGGITWLHRWAITRGMDPSTYRGEPETNDWVLEMTRLREHLYEDDD